MPPSSLQSRLYWAWPGARLPTSLVTRRCRKLAAPLPRKATRPMWLTSKSPAAPRTAACSWRTLEYCCGISQPAKSTIRPPNARWRSKSGVRLGTPGALEVVLQAVRVQVLEELLIVPAPCFGDQLAQPRGALGGPFQLLGDLLVGGGASLLPAHRDLGSLIGLRILHQLLGGAVECHLLPLGGRHLGCDLGAGKALEVGGAALPEGPDGREQADRAFLDQLVLIETGAGRVEVAAGQPDHQSQVLVEEARLGLGVPARRPPQQARPLVGVGAIVFGLLGERSEIASGGIGPLAVAATPGPPGRPPPLGLGCHRRLILSRVDRCPRGHNAPDGPSGRAGGARGSGRAGTLGCGRPDARGRA